MPSTMVWILIIHIPFHGFIFDEITGNHDAYATQLSCEFAKLERLGYYQEQDAKDAGHPPAAPLAAKALECVRFDIVGN